MRTRSLLTTLLAGVTVLVAASPAAALVPSTARVSLNATGGELAGASGQPAISANGRWVAFDSAAPNVVPGDANGRRDVFLRDRETGEVRRISDLPSGQDANGDALAPSISADGRYVAFHSWASNLAPATTNAADDVFLYDRLADKLTRLSTTPAGNDGGSISHDAQVSPDGTHVVFTSDANDLVPGDAGLADVFRFTIATGKLERVSVAPGGAAPNGASSSADVSDGGRYVAFTSSASNLVAQDANGFADVFVRDMATGDTSLVSVSSSGGQANHASVRSSITAGGCVVAFTSYAGNLVAGDGVQRDKVFVRDRCKGSTEVASLTDGGAIAGTRASRRPAVSDDGCVVAFVSPDATAAAPNTWAAAARDRCAGVTSRLDVSTGGTGGNAGVETLAMSASRGRYVVLSSSASNLVAGDGNGFADVFVRDRAAAAPPAAALEVRVEGRRVTADASASDDPDGRIATVKLAFGDGSPEQSGTLVSHQYARDGSFTVTATVTDADGLTTTATRVVTVADPAAPVEQGPGPGPDRVPDRTPRPEDTRPRRVKLSGGALSRTLFLPAKPDGRVRGRRGARLQLAASERSTATLVLERLVRGRAGTPPRWASAGRVGARLRAGENDLPFTGRVKGRPLPPGTYRFTATARTADGRSSRPLTRRFTIDKEKS